MKKYALNIYDLTDIPVGEIMFEKEYKNGVMLRVRRSFSSYCAYVGVPQDHPFAGFNYNKMNDILSKKGAYVHGGLTYSDVPMDNLILQNRQDHKIFPESPLYWYGWDFARAGDRMFYERVERDKLEKVLGKDSITLNGFPDDRTWTLVQVIWNAKGFIEVMELPIINT